MVLGKGVENDDVGGPDGGSAPVQEVVARGVEGDGVVDGEVGVERYPPASGRLDLGHGGRRAHGVRAVVDAQVVTGLGEGEGDREPQAAARARDEGGHCIRPIGSSRVSARISVAYEG